MSYICTKEFLHLKFFISFFIVFTIAIRPVLPMINYAINYDYIVKNLCEKKDVRDSTCKGKCFVSKEIEKTEKQCNSSKLVKIVSVDVFLAKEILFCSKDNGLSIQNEGLKSDYINLFSSEYFSRIFHPPLV